MRKIIILLSLCILITTLLNSNILGIDYIANNTSLESYFIIDSVEYIDNIWSKYTIKYFDNSGLIKEEVYFPEFINAVDDTVYKEEFLVNNELGISFEGLIDSTFRVYNILTTGLSAIAIEEKYYSKTSHFRMYDPPGTEEDYYLSGEWPGESEQNRNITIKNSSGEQLYTIDLLTEGFVDREPLNMFGEYTYLPPYGDVVLVSDNRITCIKQSKGNSLFYDAYRFFSSNGDSIYTNAMRATFTEKDFCEDSEYSYIVSVKEDSIFLEKFNSSSHESSMIGTIPFEKWLETYIFNDGDNIALFNKDDNLFASKSKNEIILFNKWDLSLNAVFSISMPDTLNMLLGFPPYLIYDESISDISYIRALDYYTAEIFNLVDCHGKFKDIYKIDNTVFVSFELEDSLFKIYNINMDSLSIVDSIIVDKIN